MIDALSRQQHQIPSRDSNLTYLLKNSLGGDAKTAMLATISPSSTAIDETINTLRYAGLAATITNAPCIKTPHPRHEIDESIQTLVDRMNSEDEEKTFEKVLFQFVLIFVDVC